MAKQAQARCKEENEFVGVYFFVMSNDKNDTRKKQELKVELKKCMRTHLISKTDKCLASAIVQKVTTFYTGIYISSICYLSV